MLHGEHGRKNRRRDAAGHLERTARFGSVAYHAGKIGYHVLHGVRHLFVPAPHQVGNATARPRGGHHAPAKSRKPAEALFDIDDRQVAEDERPYLLLLQRPRLLGIHHHRKRRRDSLIATSRIAHDGYHRPAHAGVARPGGIGKDTRQDAVSHNMPLHVAPQQASERMAVLSRKGDLGGMFVHVCRLQYEPQLVQRSGTPSSSSEHNPPRHTMHRLRHTSPATPLRCVQSV